MLARFLSVSRSVAAGTFLSHTGCRLRSIDAAVERGGHGVSVSGDADHAYAGPGRDAARPIDGARRLLVREDQGAPRVSAAPSSRVPAPAGARALRPAPAGVV